MSKKNGLTGLNPLAYLGVEPSSPPEIIMGSYRPTVNTGRHSLIGTWWLMTEAQEAWILISKEDGEMSWLQLYPNSGSGAGAVNFVTDAGTATQAASIINFLGGSNIETSGSGNSVKISLSNSISLSGPVAIGQNILVETSATVDHALVNKDLHVESYINVGTGVSVTDGFLNSTGTTRLRDLSAGVVQSGATGILSSDGGTDGQMLTGGTGIAPAWANITSTGSTITIVDGANSIDLAQVPSPVNSVAFKIHSSGAEAFSAPTGTHTDAYLGTKKVWVVDHDPVGVIFPGDGLTLPIEFIAPVSGMYYFAINSMTFKDNFNTARINLAIETSSSYSASAWSWREDPDWHTKSKMTHSVQLACYIPAGGKAYFLAEAYNTGTYTTNFVVGENVIAGREVGWIFGYLIASY